MRPLFPLVAFAAIGACTSFGSSNDAAPDSGVVGSADGGVDADGGADVASRDAKVGDAPSADAGPCDPLIDDTFLNPRPEWNAIGDNQTFDTDAGELVLTPGGTGKDGVVWWKTVLTYDSYLHVRVDYRATNTTIASGDGFAAAWIDTAHVPVVGGLGQSLAICVATPPLTGYALAVNTRNGQLVFIDTVACNAQPSTNKADASVLADHFVEFDINPDHIIGTFDGALLLNRKNLNPAAPKTGYFGLTATATNGSTSHVIKAVKVESCH